MRDHFVDGFGRLRADLLGAVIAGRELDLVVCDELDTAQSSRRNRLGSGVVERVSAVWLGREAERKAG